MTELYSYPKIYNLGHKYLEHLFLDPVTVEEKIDGSQFSFGRNGETLFCRSKGQQIIIDGPDKMFNKAVVTAQELMPLLKDGWIYRAEYLQSPKHNSLCYERVPNKNIIIFDISPAEETYLSYAQKKEECERLGLEIVPIIYEGIVTDQQMFMSFMDRMSVLGGQKIEGVVIKNYSKFGFDKKILIGKHVSEGFKEVHKKDWGDRNPTQTNFLEELLEQYRTPARWAKAAQHLRERGELTDSLKDIGKLLIEAQVDTVAECEAEIKDSLFKWVLPNLKRAVIRGLPEWYKEELMKKQFEQKKE